MAIPLTIRRLLTIQPVDLPVFHPIAIKMQHLLETADYAMQDVVDLANEDQALAGQILNMANSTIYVGRVRSETIKDAVIRLGSQHVCNLAMAASQASLHVSANPIIHEFMQYLWMHSHACAVGGRWLARYIGHAQYADQTYMACLLHDVGKLYLLKAMERLSKVGVGQASLDKESLLEIFGELHVEMGVRVMGHWNMPRIYRNVVECHHDEKLDPTDSVMAITRLVDTVSKVKGFGLACDGEIDLLEEEEAKILSVGQAEVDGLCEAMEQAMHP
ncbi:HDOD domain-containing protein [Geomesophilobacter sediminis]|uniref:HDOD domain-containing protein n=1 Tax=Geomesophilobacter sediminis TaxID=2798584 RepID=A0A8J7JM03_9BACT|nr:HDOD domain-containing protein [Geomesophilobacter sediminis]MBJ6725535.1 HDOD domain-containing protein [Geomesophilobacter sediminis]